MNLILEIVSVLFNLAFLFFLIKEKLVCWLFGILGSLIGVYLFYETKLYSEAILYTFYVVIGIYGYYLWGHVKNLRRVFEISQWTLSRHVKAIMLSIVLSLLLGYYFDNFTDAEKTYLDAFTTIFSFLASYMEAKKILSAWIFWIILNGVSIYLYFSKGLNIYALLALVYFVISFYGYLAWKRKYENLECNLEYVQD